MQNSRLKKKVLFIDRDGTLIMEPINNLQVDSLEKLEFYPGVFQGLGKIASMLNFELVMITNQDGLGTNSFPENNFWPAHNKMLQSLKNEGISFSKVFIDRSFPEDNMPTRKPGTELLKNYFSNEYDLENSFVIGDRYTDVQLANNLNAKAILISEQGINKYHESELNNIIALRSTSWTQIYEFLRLNERTAIIERNTLETKIRIELDLDGTSKSEINTGLGFFDHMLEQIAKHSGINLSILTIADLEVDEHHCIEDTGIALGQAFKKALADKLGIERYGFCLPMDDCLAQVALDFGGRNKLVWNANFKREKIGDMPSEMFAHFFESFSNGALCNLNIKAEGTNEHHKIEGIFKAFARSIRMAIKRDVDNLQLPSSKGIL